MTTPHVHAELIKAWADGAEIEYKSPSDTEWHAAVEPSWYRGNQYRIKPSPTTVKWLWAYRAKPAKNWVQDDTFLTEDEAKSYFEHYPEHIKLEWTRTEFPA